jgi:hypothetical protein
MTNTGNPDGVTRDLPMKKVMDFELNVQLGPNDPSKDTVIDGSNLSSSIRIASPFVSQAEPIEFGNCSVYDFTYDAADEEPFQLPVPRYLEEMLISMQAAPRQGRGNGSKEQGDKKPSKQARANWYRIKDIFRMDCVQEVVRALFWIVVGIIMKRVDDEVIAELRRRLARSWYLLSLEVHKKAHEGTKETAQEIHDWLCGALPVLIVQCIYRLMVDAFSEDKSKLVHLADEALEKIMRVVSYEICGFRRNTHTLSKERTDVFQKAVLENPFLNQHDSLKSQMRIEFIQCRNKKDKDSLPPPLVFGEQSAMPLDEKQLEHVMQGREQDRDNQAFGKVRTPVPDELSIDRYFSIAHEGEELFHRHMQELNPDYVANTWECMLDVPEVMVRQCSEPNAERPATGLDEEIAKTSRTVSAGGQLREAEKRRREAKENELRRREDLLQKNIVDEPLPREFCDRSLDTSWVSPIIDRLAPGERDRQVLCKKAADSRNVAMELPALVRSKSEPLLKCKKTHEENKLPKIVAEGVPAQATKPYAKAIHDFDPDPTHSRNRKYEMTLEPPSSLKNSLVLSRLEEHLKQHSSKSFRRYTKEHDITSGQKKKQVNPEAMRRAESAYISSMHALVGPPSSTALRQVSTPMRKTRLSHSKNM